MIRQKAQEHGAGKGRSTVYLAPLVSTKLKRLGLGMHRSLAGTREDMVIAGQGVPKVLGWGRLEK